MKKIDNAIAEFREMDELAAQDSPLHRLNPLAKLVVTLFYIVLVVSFNKYDFSRLAVMVLYPLLIFQMSGIRLRTCFYKLRFVLPLVCAVGIFNPIFDRSPMLFIGGLAVSRGVISMITLMLKGVLCVMASFILVASTPFDSICAALRKLHLPGMIVTLLLLTYRYVSVMMDELSVMTDAYMLRAPGQKGIQFSAWGSFLGQLLLRSMDRAEELYSSMRLRGFSGDFVYSAPARLRHTDILFLIISLAVLSVFRFYNVADAVGGIFL